MALAILFIEDNPADHLLAERALRQAGLLGDSLRVDSDAALREALRSRHWDLLLSDYSVPGVRFTDTLALVLREHKDLPLILLSATVGDAKAAVLLHLGARAYVPKSRLHDLAHVIERTLAASPAAAASDAAAAANGDAPGG